MSDENPQDQQTVGATVPKEPGEIGWHADAPEPGDLSSPEPGSGGVGPYEPPETTPPTLADPEPEVAPEPEPEPVAEPEVVPEPEVALPELPEE